MPETPALPSDAVPFESQETAEDRRRHRRIALSLGAKLVLPDGAQVAAAVRNVSAGGAEVAAKALPPVGGTVVAYVERIGRIEGQVIRPTRDGFVLSFSRRAARAKRLADALTWVVTMGPERDRRTSRRYPKDEAATLVRACGDAVACRILDISTGGAAIAIESHGRPAVGEAVVVGKVAARVVRHHESGIGVVFAGPAGSGGTRRPDGTKRDGGDGAARVED